MRPFGEDETEESRLKGGNSLEEPAMGRGDPPTVEVWRIERPVAPEPLAELPEISKSAQQLAPHEAFPPHIFRPPSAAEPDAPAMPIPQPIPGAPTVHVERIERSVPPTTEEAGDSGRVSAAEERMAPEPSASGWRAGENRVTSAEPPVSDFQKVQAGPEPQHTPEEPVVPEDAKSAPGIAELLAATQEPESAYRPEVVSAAPMASGAIAEETVERPVVVAPVPAAAIPAEPIPLSREPVVAGTPKPEPLPVEPAAVASRWQELREGRTAPTPRMSGSQLPPMAFPPLTRGVIRDDEEREGHPLLRATAIMLFLLAALGALGWGGWWGWIHRDELLNRAGLSKPAPGTTPQITPPPAPAPLPKASKPAEMQPAEPKIPIASAPSGSPAEDAKPLAPAAARPAEPSRVGSHASEDKNYHPEIVPPYPTLPERPSTAPQSQPVPSAVAPGPLGIRRPTAPVVNQQRPGQNGGQPSAQGFGVGAGQPAVTPAPAYTASPDGTYMSPLAQNILAVQQMQRQSTVPLREFHGRVGAAANAAKGVALTMQSANAANGSYSLLVNSGGSSYPLRGRVKTPLYFSDAATHTAYELVILRIVGGEAYGYVQPPQ